MMKETYITPVMDVVELENDVILASQGSACMGVCPADGGIGCGSDVGGGLISGGGSHVISGGSGGGGGLVISGGGSSGGSATTCGMDSGSCLAHIAPYVP